MTPGSPVLSANITLALPKNAIRAKIRILCATNPFV
jgi:hypothetical protein